MAKRFTDTEIYDEDWFLELESEYMFFWKWICDVCDHAGVWKPNLIKFKKLTGFNITLEKAMEGFNNGKERIVILENGRWFITGFIPFQYGRVLNMKSRMHQTILKSLEQNNVSLTSIRPLVEVLEGSIRPLVKGIPTLKEKEKEKEKEKVKDFKKRGESREGKRFLKPTPEEIAAYAREIGFVLDGQNFFDWYESKGWVIGKSPMKSWKAAVRTWKTNQAKGGTYGQKTDASGGVVGASAEQLSKYPRTKIRQKQGDAADDTGKIGENPKSDPVGEVS